MQNERGFDTASQSQFVPFRRTSAHMDPAIQSSRPLASDYPDGHHLNYNNQQNDHSQQRQKAILQQLSTLRRVRYCVDRLFLTNDSTQEVLPLIFTTTLRIKSLIWEIDCWERVTLNNTLVVQPWP